MPRPELLGDLPSHRLNAAILDFIEPGFLAEVIIDQSRAPEPGVAALELLQQLLQGSRPIMIDPQFVAEMGLIVPPHAELMRVVDRPDQPGIGDGFWAAEL